MSGNDGAMLLKVSPYSVLLERKLFLSTTQATLALEIPDEADQIIRGVSGEDTTGFTQELHCLKYFILTALAENKKNRQHASYYIQAAALAKSLLLSSGLSVSDYGLIYTLWEIRLSALVLSSDSYCFSIAKQEAKKLSNHLFKVTHALHGENRRIGFPANVPLSLSLLVIRLRTNSPSILCASELYSVLWLLRGNVSRDLDNKALVDSSTMISYLLSFNISANLIAKREYLTFLTHADSVIKNLKAKFVSKADDKQYEKSLKAVDKQLFSHYCLLASLVLMIQGDYAKSETYANKLKVAPDGSLDDLVATKCLQKVLTVVSPILDTDGLLDLEPLQDAPQIKTWDDLLTLNKNTRITGRILCCYCSYVELLIRSDETFVDILHSAKKKSDLFRQLEGVNKDADSSDASVAINKSKENIEDTMTQNTNGSKSETTGDNKEIDNKTEIAGDIKEIAYTTIEGKKTGTDITNNTEESSESLTLLALKDQDIDSLDVLICCWKLNIHKLYGFE